MTRPRQRTRLEWFLEWTLAGAIGVACLGALWPSLAATDWAAVWADLSHW